MFASPWDIPVSEQYVFTSLRYDGCLKKNTRNPTCCPEIKTSNAYLLKFHFDRLADAANRMGWYDVSKQFRKKPTNFINRIQKAVSEHQESTSDKCPFKIRIRLRPTGRMNIDVEPILSRQKPLLFPTTLDLDRQKDRGNNGQPLYKLVMDALPSKRDMFTRDKTHLRTTYNYARQSAGIQSYQDAKEVLLFNCDYEAMDCSITTPYFYRNEQWVTPQLSCGGQQGTTRRWAIDQELCVQGIVHVDSIQHGEVIWLSNAVKGFFTARFVSITGRCGPPSYRSSSMSSTDTAVHDEPEDSDKSLKSML